MGKRTCRTCEWFVEETVEIGYFSHRYAKEKGSGFCVLAELFTYKEATEKACKEYQKEQKEK